MATDDQETYVPRVPAPEGSASRVRGDDVLDQANRIAGQTWQDDQGTEHPYVEPAADLTPDDLGMTPHAADDAPEEPTPIGPAREAKRGRGRKRAPNPDTHTEVPTEKQEERAEQAIMELGTYEGRQVDRREIKISGSAGVSAYHPEGVEFWKSLRLGQRVAFTVVGEVSTHGFRSTTDKEGFVIEIIQQRAIKIDTLVLRDLADVTEGLPLFENGTKTD